MKRLFTLLLSLAITASAEDVEQWRVHEITLTAAKVNADPFMNLSVTAVFSGPESTVIRRPAFWDGSQTWKIRFAPTLTGTWTYTTTCSDSTDTGLQGQTGSLECVPYTGDLEVYKHGFLKTSDSRRHLAHADDEPFWYLGDTHWFMESEDYDTAFRPMVDKRLTQKYTVYQSHPGRGNLSNSGATAIDTLKYRHLDRYFQYLADKGMVHAFGLCCHNAIDYFTPEGVRRVAKTMCARYGAYPVIFFTSQEVDLWGNDARWKNAFDEWNLWDDYNHPATCHLYYSTSGETMLWGTDPQHDLFFLQGGHGTVHSMAHYKAYWDFATPAKPFIEAENNYEEITLGGSNHSDMVRKAAYKAIQCGAAGFGYGANGLWNNCFSMTDCSCCEEWGINLWSEAILFPGGAQMQYLTEFYTGLDWWDLVPRFSDPAWSSIADPENAVLKTIGSSVYVVYFTPYGSSCVLRNMADSTTYRASWFNPQNGTYTLISSDIHPSSGAWTVPAKPDNNDWLLLVQGDVDTTRFGLVRVRPGAGGRIFPAGDLYLLRSVSVDFKVVPKAGFEIEDVLLDASSLGPVFSYTLDSVGSGHLFSASFTGSTPEGLVAWWPLEGYLPNMAVDMAGSHDGSVLGGAVFQDSGAEGRWLALDGSSGQAAVPDHADFGNLGALSLSCRINLAALPAQNAAPVCKEGAFRIVIGSTGGASFVVATSNNGWYTAGTSVSFGTALQTDTWYDLTAVYDGSHIRTYVNGVPAQTTTSAISGAIIDNDAALTLGFASSSNINWFSGRIDDVRIYNIALSDTAVTGLSSHVPAEKTVQKTSLACTPTPFNPSCRISFTLQRGMDVRLTVHAPDGRLVRVMAEGSYRAGRHSLTLDGTGLAAGVYACRLMYGGKALVNKIVFIK